MSDPRLQPSAQRVAAPALTCHPLVAQACHVPAPRTRRPSGGWADPDRMVVFSSLVSVIILPFLL